MCIFDWLNLNEIAWNSERIPFEKMKCVIFLDDALQRDGVLGYPGPAFFRSEEVPELVSPLLYRFLIKLHIEK